ncbi:DUF4167 domain-containing protein [Bradyrhizobium sp. 2TAF24]|uniref:DUF4167 domain-containing protein n=1 Tax=Bradyrhizobium sp. 2TAF24 TaxID=3233011 RepID=UPI003F8EC1B8
MRNGQNNNKRMRNRNNHSNNNNRRGQNPMTRVYDSNGPDVKIRGTAAHIAEKYLQLARDSQSSGDPVAAENYYQHAEHYFRLIAAAQEQFRQNQPQPQQQVRSDQDGDDEESFSNFGTEPGFGLREPQPSYQSRESQQSYQPREQHRDRDPGSREQPREQNLREGRSQPAHQDSDAGDVDRLPSFITGAQPQPNNGTNGYEGNGHQGGDRFPPRRRRRPHGPRGEGRNAAQPSLSEDFSSGE